MKRLLAISWAMPPMLFPRAIQVARLLWFLRQHGWHSTVVTVDEASLVRHRNRDDSLEQLYSDGYERVRVPSIEDRAALRLLAHVSARWRARPDTKRVWIAPALRAASQRLSAARHEAIASFAQPWSDHLVGLALKRRSGLPWLAHFSDPWVDSPYATLAGADRRWAERAEAEVVQRADTLVFVSDETRDLVMRKYSAGHRAKAVVVPHGFDPRLTGQAPTGAPGGRLRVVHTGNLYEGRTPAALVEAVARLRSRSVPVEVVFVGQIASGFAALAQRAALGDAMRFEGARSFEDAAAHARRADVLLVVDAPGASSVFLPSKLIEYLSYRRPILGLTPTRGASADLLRALGCPVVPPDDAEQIAGALATLADRRQHGTLALPDSFETMSGPYDMRNVATRFAAALDHMIAAPVRAEQPPCR